MRIAPIAALVAVVLAGACGLVGEPEVEDDDVLHCYLVSRAGNVVTIDSVLPDTTNACVFEVDIEAAGDSVLVDTMFKAFKTAPRANIGM